ncbi:hypothetical protein FWK35_00014143, partial [Aphis craccivora]
MSRNDNDLSSNDFKYFISRRYLKISLLRVENLIQNLNSDSERSDECVDFTMMCVKFKGGFRSQIEYYGSQNFQKNKEKLLKSDNN